MLLNVHVKNLAIIDEVDVCFSDHLNILTGETGAGKSVIIGSVSLALGGKVPKDIVREGAEYALVELVFELEEEIRHVLEDLGLHSEDGQVIISRRIMGSRSVSKINGETVTLAQVRQLAGYLLDIHGQHEHQSLLYKKNHLEILDKYIGEEATLKKQKLKEEVFSYREMERELEALTIDEEKRLRELSFLEYEIREIEEAAVRPGEEEELTVHYRKLSNAEKLSHMFFEAHQLTGYDDGGAGDAAGRALKLCSRAAEMDADAEGLVSQLSDIEALINDFNRDLADYLEELTFDEEEFSKTRDRLDLLHHLMSKYGKKESDILDYLEQAKEKQKRLENSHILARKLAGQMEEHRNSIIKSCGKLTQLRIKYAGKLSQCIMQALVDLNFLDVHFELEFCELEHFTENGLDDVQFLISTNPGEPLRPLVQIASGGELSRVMLAIKSVMAENDAIYTLIFDEIDVGISGRTAQKVSEKLAQIALNHQVLCITHLAQIAAMADSHYVIEKKTDGKKTATGIRLLQDEEAVEELARILGGALITDTVRNSASEMKKLAKTRM